MEVTEEMHVYEDFCMEMFLQWLQVRRQQCLNMRFATPYQYNDGELAAYNAVIRQLENSLQKRNEYWTACLNSSKEMAHQN